MNGTCPICDAPTTVPATTEVSEVITCADCGSRLVVENIDNQTVSLGEAPKVEEDWGE